LKPSESFPKPIIPERRKGDEKMKNNILERPITRREFGRLVAMVGFTSAFGALAQLAMAKEIPTFEKAKEKARSIQLASAKNPDYTIRMGIASHTPLTMSIMGVGYYKFAEELMKRSEGRINVKLFGANSLCTELDCAQKLMTRTIEAAGPACQNAATTFKYLNCVDYPLLFPSRANMHYFLYSKTCEKYFREVLRKKYKVEFLWAHVELRDLFAGLKYKNKPAIRHPKDFKGAKVRVTYTDLGRIGLEQMGLNPIPLNWSETLEGLRSGVVDGQETFCSAAAAFNMAPVTAQVIGIQFMAGNCCAFLSHDFFKKLPTNLQETVLETAFQIQQYTQRETEKRLVEKVGYQEPPKPGTIFAEAGTMVNILNKEELQEWRTLFDPMINPDPYKKWRERLAKIAGKDVFEIFYNKAREIPEDTPVEKVKPQRWWT
jgi:TRAP-type C4-dicarboxylate transport system substrate-binding protein